MRIAHWTPRTALARLGLLAAIALGSAAAAPAALAWDNPQGGLVPVTCGGQVATIVGTSGDDVLSDTPGHDVIALGAGNDSITLNGGHDLVCGGPGADTYRAYGDGGSLRGEDGADTIMIFTGSYSVHGGLGNDIISTGSAALGQVIMGEGGDDLIFGGVRQDFLSGNDGADRLFGGDGADYVRGHAGNDRLFGGYGDDTVEGGDGSDWCQDYASEIPLPSQMTCETEVDETGTPRAGM